MKITFPKNNFASRSIKKGLKFCTELLKEEEYSKHEVLKHRALTGYLKKNYCSPRHVEKILNNCPNTSSYIGALPDKWIMNVPKENRGLFTHAINRLFTDFAKTVSVPHKGQPVQNANFIGKIKNFGSDLFNKNEVVEQKSPAEIFEEAINVFVEKFKKVTGKDADISYLGKGSIGRTFKLNADGDSFVIKTFYPDPETFGYHSTHGKGAEILNAVFASKNARKNDYAKFYFGKFAKENDNDGFMVTKFLDFYNADLSNIQNPILRDMGVKVFCGDKFYGTNMVLDTIYDYGAVVPNNLKNNTQYKIKRLITEAVDNNDFKKFNSISDSYSKEDFNAAINEFKNEVEDMIKYGNYEERYQNFNLVSAIDAFKVKHNYIPVADSKEKYKYYRLLNKAIRTNDDEAYKNIIEKKKRKKDFDEVFKVYNKDEYNFYYLRTFDDYIDLYQYKKLIDTLEKFKINIDKNF